MRIRTRTNIHDATPDLRRSGSTTQLDRRADLKTLCSLDENTVFQYSEHRSGVLMEVGRVLDA